MKSQICLLFYPIWCSKIGDYVPNAFSEHHKEERVGCADPYDIFGVGIPEKAVRSTSGARKGRFTKERQYEQFEYQISVGLGSLEDS